MVVVRFISLVAVLFAGCAAEAEREGPSRIGAEPAGPSLAADRLTDAAADATLVARAADGAPWRAFLGADGTARRMEDGARGQWHIDSTGRLCTSFPDHRNCWWVVRDGSSEPAFRGDRPGERARLAPTGSEL